MRSSPWNTQIVGWCKTAVHNAISKIQKHLSKKGEVVIQGKLVLVITIFIKCIATQPRTSYCKKIHAYLLEKKYKCQFYNLKFQFCLKSFKLSSKASARNSNIWLLLSDIKTTEDCSKVVFRWLYCTKVFYICKRNIKRSLVWNFMKSIQFRWFGFLNVQIRYGWILYFVSRNKDELCKVCGTTVREYETADSWVYKIYAWWCSIPQIKSHSEFLEQDQSDNTGLT